MTSEETAAVLELYGLKRLKEATPETWFEEYVTHDCENCFNDYGCKNDSWIGFMPDFPNDDGAAVKLAERMRAELRYADSCWAVLAWVDGSTFLNTDDGTGFGSLGAALLFALTVAQVKHDQ